MKVRTDANNPKVSLPMSSLSCRKTLCSQPWLPGRRLPAILSTALLFAATWCSLPGWAVAAPWGVWSPPWRERFQYSQAVVIAQPVENPAEDAKTVLPSSLDLGPAQVYRITSVLKGEKLVQVGSLVKLSPWPHPFIQGKPHAWLATYNAGFDGKSSWSYARRISEIGERYAKAMAVEPEPPEETELYYRYWKLDDPAVREDARRQLRRKNQLSLWQIRDTLSHELLSSRARDGKLSLPDRSLAMRLLAVVPQEGDDGWLQEIAFTDDEAEREDLADAGLEAYLSSVGEAGLVRVERDILRNEKSKLHWQALAALHRHIQSEKFIARERGLQAYRLALDLPNSSNNCIVELRKMEDWQALDHVAQTGLKAILADRPEKCLAVFGYLFQCPLPKAQQYLVQFKKLAPEVYHQAEQRSRPETNRPERGNQATPTP